MNFSIYLTLTKSVIKSNIGRFLILVFICALGAGFYCGMNQVPNNMMVSLNNMLDNNNLYDYKITSDNGLTKSDAEELDGIASKQYDTVAEYNSEKHVIRFQQYLNSQINKLELTEGRFPNSSNEGVAISSQIENTQLCVGDTINMQGKEINIVGIVNSAEYFNYASVGYTKIADGLLENVVFITEETFDPLMPYYCAYCKGTAENIDQKYTVYTRDDNDSIDCYTSDVERIKSLAKIFPLIFYLIAVVVTITVISRKIAEDRRSLGILLSLGIKRRIVLLQYLSFSVLAALLGSAIGVLAFTTFLPQIFMIIYSSIYNVATCNVQYDEELIAITMGITIFVVVITTLFCVVKTIWTTPNKLLHPKSQKSARHAIFAKSALWKKIPSTWQATIRAILVYPMRFITSIINIACCTILFMCSLNLYYSSTGMINKQINEVAFDNYTVYLNTEKHNVVDSICKTDPNIVDYSYCDNFVVNTKIADNQDMYCTGIWTDDYNNFHNLRSMKSINNGEPLTPSSNGVVITQRLAEVANLSAGDKISISTDGKNYTDITIDGIAQNYIYNYVYFGKGVVRTLTNEEPQINSVYINSKDVNALNNKIQNLGEVQIGKTLSSTYAYFKELISTTVYIALLLIAITCIMSFTVLYSLTTIAVCERTKELSVLSMLGFKNRLVSLYVHRDTLFHLIIGLPLGLLLGSQLCIVVLKAIEGQSILFDRTLNASMIACTILLVLIFVLISVFVLALQTNRIKLTGATKGEE